MSDKLKEATIETQNIIREALGLPASTAVILRLASSGSI